MKKVFTILSTVLVFLTFGLITFAQGPATDSADEIRQRVQEKVNQALNVPHAYIGTVTDIAENTIQINKLTFAETKKEGGEILQVSVSEEDTEFAKVNETSQTISFEDVAIGDFVVAMGFKNGNGVLEAIRILVSTPPITAPTRRAVYGEIVSIEKREVILKDKDSNEWTLDFPTRWKGPETEDLEEGGRLIAVGEVEDFVVDIRTIHLVEIEPSPTP